MPSTEQKIAVVGAGVTGLCIALLLSDAGHAVTVVARNIAGDYSTEWASPWAGAVLAPHPDYGLEELQEQSLRAWRALAQKDENAGIRAVKVTEYYDDRPNDAYIWYRDSVANFRKLGDSDMVAGTTLGFTYDSHVINPNQFLPWAMQQLRDRRVEFLKAAISSIHEAKVMTGAAVVVNASGLGARELAGDDAVEPLRGQTMFVKTPTTAEVILRQGSQYTYMIPRPSDGGFILGGVSQPGNTQSDPDRSLRQDILDRVNQLTRGRFSWLKADHDVIKDFVGFRPGRKGGVRVERDGDVIHAYGVGPLGYVFAFGVAAKVKGLLEKPLTAKI